jgi:tetratricopeptide (TPR) repeat protein
MMLYLALIIIVAIAFIILAPFIYFITKHRVKTLINNAVALVEMDENDEAIVCCDELLKKSPNLETVLLLKATALLKLDKTAEALDCYRKAESLGNATAKKILIQLASAVKPG